MDSTRCNTLKLVPTSSDDQVRIGENLEVSHGLVQPGSEVWVEVVVGRPAVHHHSDDQTSEIRHRLFYTGCHKRTQDRVGPIVARLGQPRSSRRKCCWTHNAKLKSKCLWLGLRLLCQKNASYVLDRLVLRTKKFQVHPRLLKFLLLVAFRAAVGVGLSKRAPFGRSVASSAFLTHLLSQLVATRHQPRAVSLEVAIGLALVVLISARHKPS